MIILDAINRSLEIKLAGAISTNNLPVVVSYVDVTTLTYGPLSTPTVTNGVAAVTIAAAPAASTQRQIKYISVTNTDTATATVIIQYNDNGTIRQIIKVTLGLLDTLFYTDGEGWRVMDSAGKIKVTVSGTGAQWGDITGTLANQTDLQAELDLKRNKALADGKVWIGDGMGQSQPQTPSGDVTMSNTGVTTIGPNKVIYTKAYNGFQLALVASLKGLTGN